MEHTKLEDLHRKQDELIKQINSAKEGVQDAGEVNTFSAYKELVYTVLGLLFVFGLGIVSFYFSFDRYFYLVLAIIATFGILRLFNVLVSLGGMFKELTKSYSRMHRLLSIQHRETLKAQKENKDLLFIIAAHVKMISKR